MTDEQLDEALQRDPVTAAMDQRQLRRIKHWLKLFTTSTVIVGCQFVDDEDWWACDEVTAVFVRSPTRKYVETNTQFSNDREEVDEGLRPPIGINWVETTLDEVLRDYPVSKFYVKTYHDADNWVSVEEIGNDDDYQP